MNYFLENLVPEVRDKLTYQPTTAAFLDYIAASYGPQIALSEPDREIRYEELPAAVAKRRGLLAERGICSGCNIGLMAGNSVNAVLWFLAATSFGCTVVMFPPALRPDVIADTLEHYEIRLLIHDGEIADMLLPGNIPAISVTETGNGCVSAAVLCKEDRAAVFFTGGTTGKPKGVILSHGALMRGSLNGAYRRGTVYGQSMVAALPFTHVFGIVFGLLSGLYSGAHVGVCGNMKYLFREMRRVNPTTMIAVPGLAEMMLNLAEGRGAGILGDRLNLIICGAAPVPERLYHSFQKYGIDVLAGYGLTETANLVSGNLDMALHPDSVGKQYPAQSCRIVNGELQLKGDMLFDGYWKDDAATQAAFTSDGWFKTGDLARLDEEGFLYITGRIKNLIILDNGENVSPEEVEAFYYRCSCVKDCLVSETDRGGKKAILLEVLPAAGMEQDAVMAELAGRTSELPPTMRPAQIILRQEAFAKSPAMKILRHEASAKKPGNEDPAGQT